MASSAIPAVTRILDVIDAGLRDGRRFSVAPQARDRAAWRVVQGQVPALTDNEAQAVIDTWLQNGAVETRSYQRPRLSARLAWGCLSIEPNPYRVKLRIGFAHIA